MPQARPVALILTARETLEGAGVRLHRAFGYSQIPLFDPFLMLDDFRAERPEDYLKGFPWHPHRGIETVTYMLEGQIEHEDSMGHKGEVRAGGIQWMTAGSGLLHQEMPRPENGRMGGFQLWVNLPRSHKMRKPRYLEINSGDIPSVDLPGGVHVRVICGNVGAVTGPVRDIVAEPEYLDVTLAPGSRFIHEVRPGYMAAAYLFGGSGTFGPAEIDERGNRTMILFGKEGSSITIKAGKSGARLLYFSGKPLGEPIAWGGPIVMNTQAELEKASEELHNGTFIRDPSEES